MKFEIISANRLSDGRVVYLTRDGDWSESIIDAHSVHSTEERGAVLAQAERSADDGIIVSPYLVSMVDDGGTLAPLRFRERIRLFGPGTHRSATKNLSSQTGR